MLRSAEGFATSGETKPGIAGVRKVVTAFAIGAALAAAALALRIPTLDRAIAIDESRWLERSNQFAHAIERGDFDRTLQTGHPGVTTMWIAGFAQQTLPPSADLRDRYARARLGLSIAHAALIVLIWWLARGVVGETAATLGGLFLVFDPFLVAHNRVIHMDGLLALLMLSSLLALMNALERRHTKLLVLSGTLAGLAVLTKFVGVFLFVFVLVMLRRNRMWDRRWWWIVPAGITALALWPAIWTNPFEVVARVAVGAGGAAHETPGGKLLGGGPVIQSLFYYPAAFLWRSTPVILIGAGLAGRWAWRHRNGDGRWAWTLFAYAGAFAVVAAIGLKRQDRYLLPAMVALDLAVAAGVVSAARKRASFAIAGVAVLIVHGWTAVALHPYQISGYNWAVGGPVTARHVLAVGWGEGLDEAAAYLNRDPGADRLRVAVLGPILFSDFFSGRTVDLPDSALAKPGGEPVDLVLFYLSSVQTERYGDLWKRFSARKPVYEFSVNGFPYVRIYRVETSDAPSSVGG